MSIINSHTLKNKINKCNLIPLEVKSIKTTNQIELNINENEFLEFAKNAAFTYVYYYLTYYNQNDYIIPKGWYSEYSEEFKAAVAQHNRLLESFDFDAPRSLTLFIVQNGTYIGIIQENLWIDEQGISKAEDTIEEIEREFYSEVKKINDFQKEQQKEDENELRQSIFQDPEFRFCKNQERRYWYLVELLEEPEMKKYKYLVEPYGAPHIGKIKLFMDKTWMLYKERQN
ncbi:hypothetical protein FZC78_06465 [Rossellomorea vietnamensis]|uniref:Uncharacterized protein n=1 Tax=Rossellomorea vietnamensis TaxID=218284 RepID=A0A5D4NTI3_9BACI|nr:hypothetical protein [Rossellomorea vietnamensis]TYS17517.1 hypothetical protein FZC78_06465 [Rossellomorea vietnamensis]